MENEKNNFNIEDSFRQVEQLLDKMENSETGLEELFRMYKEGCEILAKCNDAIEKVEKEMIEI